MKNISLMTIVVIGLLFNSLVYADVIYTNDFGTQTQFDGLQWSVLSGSPNLTRQGPGTGVMDLDGDGLYEAVKADTNWGASRGVKHIYAPLFKTMGNFTLSGYGSGNWSAQASGAKWLLSDDGTTYDYSVSTDNNYNMHYKSISSGTDPAYNNTIETWAATEVHSRSGSVPPNSRGRTAAFKFEADISDAKVGERAWIHYNDFGTQAQRDEWTVSNTNIAYQDNSSVDTDGDDLGAEVYCSSPGNVTLTIRIDAPAGMSFKDPVGTGLGYGSKNNQGSSTRIELSTDGVNWDVSSTVPGAVNGWYDMTADATGQTGYEKLTSVWLRINMNSWSSVSLPRAKEVKVTAEIVPEPATIGLLVFGALGFIRRS